MQIIVRWLALWLLMPQMAAMAADVGRCAGTLSDEQRRYLRVCLDRGAQCTDYWPGYPDDLADCARLQKWLTKAMTMPPGMRHEIFGPMPERVAGSPEEPAPSGKGTPPAWKSLPRSQDSAAPRPVAGPMTGATVSDYAGASSQLDPEQARAAGVAFWTGQIVQIAGIVAEANSAPAGSPRSFAAPIANAPRPVAAQTAMAAPPDSQTMNPGQLFAEAEELSAQGDRVRAREVQRALMSQFPDHPLAAIAARQIAEEPGSGAADGASPGDARTASNTTGSSSPTVARQMAEQSGAGATQSTTSGAVVGAGASRAAIQVSLADCARERDTVVASWRTNDSTEGNIKMQLAAVLRDVNSADRARALRNLEQYRQQASQFGGAYPPLAYSVCMLKVRLSRLEAAPAVAGDVDGGMTSSAAAVRPVTGRRLSAQACEAMKQAVLTTRVPPNASVTASTETVMFLTKTVLNMIAGGCQTDGTTPAEIEAERQERQRQYAAAENACNAVQSGGRRCVPQAHTASDSRSAPAPTYTPPNPGTRNTLKASG